eukprot:353890-Chlamydomonas_euryale.AAC.6
MWTGRWVMTNGSHRTAGHVDKPGMATAPRHLCVHPWPSTYYWQHDATPHVCAHANTGCNIEAGRLPALGAWRLARCSCGHQAKMQPRTAP